MSRALVALVIAMAIPGFANAELILELSGITGSNIITYEASGSVTVTRAISGSTSGLGLAPRHPTLGSAAWTASFDNNMGDVYKSGGAFNENLALSGGGVTYAKNGSDFGTLELIDLDASDTLGADHVELDSAGDISYEALISGDVISWSGSGTFSLIGGDTFDSFFNTGTYSNLIDGGNYTVIVSEGTPPPPAVPEPSSLALLSGGALAYGFYRRRKNRKSKTEKSNSNC